MYLALTSQLVEELNILESDLKKNPTSNCGESPHNSHKRLTMGWRGGHPKQPDYQAARKKFNPMSDEKKIRNFLLL